MLDKHIVVFGQHTKYGYASTKNHKSRTIPVTEKIIEELETFKAACREGYLFSTNGGKKPITARALSAAFKRALTILGIMPDEQKSLD